jgi:type IV pilus assembly protein PilQ
MIITTTEWKKIACTLIVITLSAAMAVGAASATALPDKAETNRITGILVHDGEEAVVVDVQADKSLTYTVTRVPDPLGVVFYFPGASLYLDNLNTDPAKTSGVVEAIKATEVDGENSGSRLEILLKSDTLYDVTKGDHGIGIAFAKPEKAASDFVGVTATAAASMLSAVTPTSAADGTRIEVVADGSIADYQTFTIDNPARIVFDIPGLGSPYKKEQLVPVNSEWVSGVRYYGYPDKLRMVLDTRSEYLDSYSATPTDKGLVILVSGKGTAGDVSEAPATVAAAEPAEPEVEAEEAVVAAATAETTGSDTGSGSEEVSSPADSRPRWLNRLDFTSEDSGASTLLVGTTDRVDYSVDKSDPVRIRISLENTMLPKYRKRPLITTRFESAVNRVLPVQTAAMKNTAAIVVELREAVPFTVTQEDNLLLVSFEASTVPPKPLEQAALPDWQTVTEEVLPDPVPVVEESLEEGMPAADEKSEFGDGESLEQKYTGEKIALDFYETDIKNVFRILRDVSGLNFAIDKNVTGKVTLTLEKPVPWDQVLDLVLKMNQLGKVYEGDIVRIATLATIKKEAKLRREKLAAEQKAKKQKEALEPLVTEYVPVNYSTAGTEILPHIEKLSSKGRGSITVDERNNQLIITDTVDVIEKMKAIVAEIDQVTPQVVIEARVVEANSDFTREVGFDWGTITIGPVGGWPSGGDRYVDHESVGEQPAQRICRRARLLLPERGGNALFHPQRSPAGQRDPGQRQDHLFAQDHYPGQQAGKDQAGRGVALPGKGFIG